MQNKFKRLAVASLLLGISMLAIQAAAPATPQGFITARYFLDIGGGTAVADLTNNVKFPDAPDIVRYEPHFEAWAEEDINTPPPSDVRNNYGAQIVGYFYPATSGEHVFYLSADDNARLFLSTDDNPANKRLIAQESGWSNPRMWESPGGGSTIEEKSSQTFTGTQWPTPGPFGGAAITLQAGQPYYIEAIVKEGGGGDNLAVSIDGLLPIPGARLSPFSVATEAVILGHPQDAAVYAGSTANFSVAVDIPPTVTVTGIRWQKNGVDIPNSDSSELALPATAADNNATIRAIITTSAGVLTSSEATLNVATLTNEFTPGVVKFEAYTGITGTSVDQLLFDEKFPDSPDDVRLLTAINTPNGYGDNYGARVSGFIIPPETGSYRFFLRSDDASQLWLSTGENPANAEMIAEEVGCCDPFKEPDDFQAPFWETSLPQNLQANQRYAFYAYVKEGGGGDYLQVAVRREGDSTPAAALPPLAGAWIGANARPSLGEPQITQQPQSVPQLLQGRTTTLNLGAVVAPTAYNFPFFVQWQKNGENIPGATGATLTLTNVALADAGTYRAVVTAPSGASLNSAEATVAVQADTAPPRIANVAVTGLQSILVTFDEPVDRASAETAANYQMTDGVTVSQSTLGATGTTVLLTTSALTADREYTLTVTGVRDPFNNTVAAGTQSTFVSRVISYADIILADGPIAFYRFEETSGSVAINSGSTGGDGAYMIGDFGTPGVAKGLPGPRPPAFLGFASDNRAATLGGINTEEWIDTKNKFLEARQAFTIEYWVNPTNRVGAETPWSRIGLVGQNDAIEYGFINGTTIQIWTSGGGSLDTTYPYPDNQWHHIATIADGTNIRNYFDGVLVGTGGTATGNYGTSDFDVHIGGGGVFDATGNYFEGQFDEVAIFDKAIPAERIAIHYRAGLEGYVPPAPTGARFTTVSLTAGQLTIQWEGAGTLEEASAVTGPWTASASQANPQTVTPTGIRFYRLRQ